MDKLLFLLIVGAIAAGTVKYRSQASKERKAVLARINDEQLARGDVSPTAELFREVGVPVGAMSGFSPASAPSGVSGAVAAPPPPPPAALGEPPVAPPPSQVPPPLTATVDAPAAAPAPAPGAATPGTGDLASMFTGIQMPVGLAPFGAMTSSEVTFVTHVAARDVQPALAAELARIGAEVTWVEPTVAQVRRSGQAAGLTIFPRPELAVDLDGNRLFPTAQPETCVVRLALV